MGAILYSWLMYAACMPNLWDYLPKFTKKGGTAIGNRGHKWLIGGVIGSGRFYFVCTGCSLRVFTKTNEHGKTGRAY